MSFEELIIEGAKQNNLKNVSLVLPHDKVIAVTGVSGSGKSSLAFDTIFAEGQWRFLESLSTYARLFLEKMDRPAVDAIRNIRPAIALEQRNPVRGSRSIVGTITEIYDYFRLLYSKIGEPFCPSCGQPIRKWDPTAIKQGLLSAHAKERALIVFESREPAEVLKGRGFYRYFDQGRVVEFEGKGEGDHPFEISSNGNGLAVVLDRLVIRDDPRLADSIETAFRHGGGRMKVLLAGEDESSWRELRFSAGNVCDNCGKELLEPSPLLFSFNHPIGACPECKGFGNILRYSEDLIVPDPYLSVSEGAIEPWEKPSYKWWKRQMLKAFKNADKKGKEKGKNAFPIDKPWRELFKSEKETLFKGSADFYGIDDFFEDLEARRYKLHVRVFLSRYRKGQTCPACGGKRLRPEALAYRVGGKDIAELTAMPVGALDALFSCPSHDFLALSPANAAIAREPLRQIKLKLGFLKRVGLDYLGLDREARTLSGGEYQRVNLSNQLASRLTGTLYVLDEPTVGLHPRDTERVADIMAELSSLGNTLVVVEHDKEIIERADWVVELGPGGGHLGGSVVFSGTQKEFLETADTLTSRYIKGTDRIKPPSSRRKPSGWLALSGASGNNLKGIDLKIPLGAFTVVSGVSGSGKSSLVVETLYRALARTLKVEPEPPLPYKTLRGMEAIHGVKLIDQSPIGRTPRSNPVTYLKIFDQIRKLYASQPEAKAHGYGPGFFSFNVPGGRCPTCGGEGYQKFEMYFFEDLFIKCEDCGASRYTPEALRVHYRDRDISQVLEMTVEEASGFFSGIPAIAGKLSQLEEIGLGYLKLGQPATTLSGGEAQRLKICAELGLPRKSDFLYVLDEPTVGLHYYDVGALLKMLGKLVDRGGTVVVIEHNLDVVEAADWVIDLGPEGGEKGGWIVYQGTPEGLRKEPRSHTGRYLKKHQGKR